MLPKKERKNLVDELQKELDESLQLSAPEFWEQAVRACHLHPDTYKNCEGYHRIWQYLVAWEVITTMRSESGQFIQYFRDLAQTGDYREIFVSATADYSMLAHILCAYSFESAEVKVC